MLTLPLNALKSMAPEPMNWYQGVACLGTVAFKGVQVAVAMFTPSKLVEIKTSKVFKGESTSRWCWAERKVKISLV